MIHTEKVLVSAIRPALVDSLWYKVAPLIEKAIEHSNGELDLINMYDKIMENDMLLLVVSEGKDNIMAAVTLEKRDFATGKTILNICTAGGSDMHLWVDKVLDIAEQMAKDFGCEDVYIVGRGGWQRQLKKNGYEVVHTVLKKKVRI
jgi:hypothetical protein